jgi:hypothetical protein
MAFPATTAPGWQKSRTPMKICRISGYNADILDADTSCSATIWANEVK